MKLVIIDKNNKARINKIVEWLIYMVGYTISFILISLIFGSFQINDDHIIIYSFLAVVIIYFLNKTIRPIILKLTMPLMGITVGLFYFVINAGILKIVDIIMGNKLDFTGGWQLFVIAVLLATTNAIIEELILKPIVRRFKKR
jgi:putative membrane protein